LGGQAEGAAQQKCGLPFLSITLREKKICRE